MQIKFPTGVIHHCRPDTGRGFIEAGLAVEVIPEKKVTIPNTEWLAIRGAVEAGIEELPRIFVKCKGCGEKMYMHGPRAHEKLVFTHRPNCGPAEKVPSHIAQEYARLRKKHDQAIAENKRKAEVNARLEAAKKSAIAAART